jgi:hypothetical protein
MEEEKMKNKKKRICRREFSRKNQNWKSIEKDRRKNTLSSSLDLLSSSLHKFYATCAPRLKEVLFVEL